MSTSVIDLYLADRAATQDFGRRLGQTLAPMTLLLEGGLGAGKTTLIQGLGEGLGIGEPIVSPTFTLICEYLEGRIPLYHLDLYRLTADAVDGLNLDQYLDPLEREPGILAIEWPDRLRYPPADGLRLTLAYGPELRAARKSTETIEAEGRYLKLEAFGVASLDSRWFPDVKAQD